MPKKRPKRRRHRRSAPKCLAPTARRGLCQNPKKTCPHHKSQQAQDPDLTSESLRGTGNPDLHGSASVDRAAAGRTRDAGSPQHGAPLAAAPASTQPPAQAWPGVQDRSGHRLCDTQGDFRQLLEVAAQAFQVSEQGLVRATTTCAARSGRYSPRTRPALHSLTATTTTRAVQSRT